ncbi:MAG: Asp-tRNA(Asn)/Glu-tRNA(Gln) amidotransferase subunit GatB [Deltaproteobacteria bacterium]|nr:Asp-tRNA(Asn)/Glu-tRNA(Gln) amidotransferase subunit GatB [Deltaproteobacteria bacterium]
MNYEAIIGLEVHAQLKTRSKIFCGCPNRFGSNPNTNVCPVCLGMPGTLPVLNRFAVELAVRTALALNCFVHKESRFARKNYFYPDLPKGYQITQYDKPLATGGYLEIETGNGPKKIRIKRIHLEEDAGKDLHDISPEKSYIDYNRSGVPLVEIVTEPDISSPEEASKFLKTLRNVLMYLEVCDGNMEEGSLRCDANISVRKKGSNEWGTKTEIKNLNSFKFLERALTCEIERHIGILERNEKIEQQTMLYDPKENTTRPMRSKEESHDYRYFEEPDLLPLILTDEDILSFREDICELPHQKKKRYIEQFGISSYEADILVQDKQIADFFEDCILLLNEPKQIASWIINDYMRELNQRKISIKESPVTPHKLVAIIKQLRDNKITLNMAREIFVILFEEGGDVQEIINRKGFEIIDDTEEIIKSVREIISSHPEELAKYKKGNQNLIGFFMGELMRRMKGKIDPKKAREIVKSELDKA